MNLLDYDYYLPESLIAQEPIQKRDMSRLMIIDKKTGQIEHKLFKDIISYLKQGDCLVLNNTRVIPARLFGTKIDTGSTVEFLLLNRLNNNQWEVIVRPGKKARPNSEFKFGDGEIKAKILDIVDGGNRIIQFEYNGVFEEILERLGNIPLPPYIKKELQDKERYQTVFSKHEGSAAAPTAGLHFTGELLEQLEACGIKKAFVTLHVGLGTFRPVKVLNIEDHKMHSEYYSISSENAKIINDTKKNGGRIVCVGTTTTRTLETAADEFGYLTNGSGWTDIFIYPGYKFKITDCMITNFHLPQSTLLMLVSAFAGRDTIINAYNMAVEEKYRFFSFGDAMLIK